MANKQILNIEFHTEIGLPLFMPIQFITINYLLHIKTSVSAEYDDIGIKVSISKTHFRAYVL